MHRATCLLPLSLLISACPDDVDPTISTTVQFTVNNNDPSNDPSNDSTVNVPTSGEPTSTSSPTATEADPTGGTPDPTMSDSETDPSGCQGDCGLVDILFVVDNSGSMSEEQADLVAAVPRMVDRLRADSRDVNVLITTTDFGHPLCTSFYKDGYSPAKGAPTTTPCSERIPHFTAYGGQPSHPEVCTNVCPTGTHADGPFVHFNGDDNNVVDAANQGDPVVEALRCMIPQGIDGCGMESPLETMLQALDPGKDWNQGQAPFLRDGSTLAIVLLSDETDCSTLDYAYFDPTNKNDPTYNQYWEDLPGMPGVKGDPTSAVCWNGGMNCNDANQDGTYESCAPADNGVLQSVDRYTNFLTNVLIGTNNHRVVMLALTGVPPVTQHNASPPYEPVAGGVLSLEHRTWEPSDILPGDPKSPAQKEYEFGIAPGCSNPNVGQAIPPGRIQRVCESLDQPGEVHCCIESVCSENLDPAMDCLTGMISLQ